MFGFKNSWLITLSNLITGYRRHLALNRAIRWLISKAHTFTRMRSICSLDWAAGENLVCFASPSCKMETFSRRRCRGIRTKSLRFDWTLYDKATLKLRNGIKSKPQINFTCQATIASIATESVTAQRYEWTSFKCINWLNIRQLAQFKSPAQFQSHDMAYLTQSSKFEPRQLLTPMYTSVNMSSLQTLVRTSRMPPLYSIVARMFLRTICFENATQYVKALLTLPSALDASTSWWCHL